MSQLEHIQCKKWIWDELTRKGKRLLGKNYTALKRCCKECSPESFCIHQKLKHNCIECNPDSKVFCIHKKTRRMRRLSTSWMTSKNTGFKVIDWLSHGIYTLIMSNGILVILLYNMAQIRLLSQGTFLSYQQMNA